MVKHFAFDPSFDLDATLRPQVASTPTLTKPSLGVVIVSYNSGDVILDCLESLLAIEDTNLHIVVVDNKSPDDTVTRLRNWASGAIPWENPGDLPFDLQPAPKPVRLVETERARPVPSGKTVTLVHAGMNGGYASGVNLGLACLSLLPNVNRFWVLNPDSIVAPGTAHRFATQGDDSDFGLMGGRINYLEQPDMIQIDGGQINWRTGATRNINQHRSHAACPPPAAQEIDFVSGASVIVSRRFLEQAGPMREEYFLYYEEVDWAMRRGDLPIVYCRGALVYHRAGTSIGSATPNRMASPMSIYFKHRNRLRFLRRFRPNARQTGHLFSVAKAVQTLLKGYPREAAVLLKASFGMRPPAIVSQRLAPDAARIAFFPALDL